MFPQVGTVVYLTHLLLLSLALIWLNNKCSSRCCNLPNYPSVVVIITHKNVISTHLVVINAHMFEQQVFPHSYCPSHDKTLTHTSDINLTTHPNVLPYHDPFPPFPISLLLGTNTTITATTTAKKQTTFTLNQYQNNACTGPSKKTSAQNSSTCVFNQPSGTPMYFREKYSLSPHLTLLYSTPLHNQPQAHIRPLPVLCPSS